MAQISRALIGTKQTSQHFVLRELMIKMFENNLSVEEMFAISTVLFVLGASRLGSVFAFQREKQMLEAVRSERQSDAC